MTKFRSGLISSASRPRNPNRMLKKSASGVLASFRGSEGLAPALPDFGELSRAVPVPISTGTVANGKGDSPLHSLRPC
ncbi:MAG: hypothetical protein EWM72_01479 [Nitrospira sp.]|nr:MAG: hypothetical protein EWM72_01479 [Nitrospira sp.]